MYTSDIHICNIAQTEFVTLAFMDSFDAPLLKKRFDEHVFDRIDGDKKTKIAFINSL